MLAVSHVTPHHHYHHHHHTEFNQPHQSLSFSSEAENKKFSIKRVVSTINKVGKVAGKVADVAGKVAMVATLI